MSLSRSYNKQNGVTYVYEVIENHWDKEKKQPRSKRKLIGKIDPETGEIVPTARKKKAPGDEALDYKKLYESARTEIIHKDRRISELETLLADHLAGELSDISKTEAVLAGRKEEAERLLRGCVRHD